jgi:RimJ/RimL family protein N-acetyltransferase
MSLPVRTSKCVVRTFRLEDAPSIARNGNNRAIWRNLRDRFPHPYTEDDAVGYIRFILAKNPYHSLAIEVDGQAVGGLSLRPGEDIERVGAEIGYWLGEPYWGRGIMTDAVGLVTDYAFRALSLERVFAVPFTGNVASCRVLEKVGFVREGLMRRSAIKDGQVLDQYLYAKTVLELGADRRHAVSS